MAGTAFDFQVRRGLIPNLVSLGPIYGHNPGIPGTVQNAIRGVLSDIGGDLMFFPSTAKVLELVSDNAADAPSMAGANEILVSGLDANFEPISEFVTLAGLTPVRTLKEYLRCSRLVVSKSADKQDGTAGTVSVNHDPDGGDTLTCQVIRGHGGSLVAAFTVPSMFNNKPVVRAFVTQMLISSPSSKPSKDVTIHGEGVITTPSVGDGDIFQSLAIVDSGAGIFDASSAAPINLEPTAEMFMRATVQGDTIAVSGQFCMMLELR